MKDWYGPMWEDHVNSNTKVLSATGLGKTRGKMGGRRVLNAVVDQYPSSAGVAHMENATITDPAASSAFQPELIARSVYVRLRWTGEVEDAARGGDKAVFAGPRATELRLARKQYAVNKGRMAILGPRQILGKIASITDDSATPQFDTGGVMESRNSRTSAAASFYNFGTHYLKKGMMFDVVSGVAVDARDGAGVDGSPTKTTLASASGNSYTLETPILTTASVDNPVAGDLIIPWGSRRDGVAGAGLADASYYAGYNGLNNLMLDASIYANIYGLARSAQPTLEGNRQTSGSGRNMNDLLLILAIDKIVEEGSGEEPDTLYLNTAIRREVIQHIGMGNAYVASGSAGTENRRFAPVVTNSGYAKLALVVGDKSMTYDTDRDCPPGMVYILRKGTMGYLSNRTLSSIDKTPERYVTNKDAHEVILAERGNFFCSSPWTNGSLEDINFDVSALTAA
jgi:hypothetical protein